MADLVTLVLEQHVLWWSLSTHQAACADPACTLEPIEGLVTFDDVRRAQAIHQADVLRARRLIVPRET